MNHTLIDRDSTRLVGVLRGTKLQYAPSDDRDSYRFADYWLRRMIGARDGYVCEWCQQTTDLHIDHVIPWSAGGRTTSRNLRFLCATCNLQRSVRYDWTDERARMDCVYNCDDCTPGLIEYMQSQGRDREFVFCATCLSESYSDPLLIDQPRLDTWQRQALSQFQQEYQ